MSNEKTYLEYSEDNGVSHKFYEVTINGTDVTTSYGRIGTNGQTKTKTYSTPEKALAEANKRIKEKLKKGYEPAVMGVRKKRPLTRRQIDSQKSKAKQAPVLWKFNSGAPAFGIFITDSHCWVGNQNGSVFVLNHEADILNQYRLPDGVKCIVADNPWVYVGCDDGCVYDLTGKLPRLAYEISENVDIFWIDINNGLLGVSDAGGTIMTANHENEELWQRKSQGDTGWMVRCDDERVYHGHHGGVTAYSNSKHGNILWHVKAAKQVLFGWQETSTVYAGTGTNKVYGLNKKTGKVEQIYQCDAAVYSCAAAKEGEYVFAGDNYSSVYCFNKAGERLWKLGTGCGSAFSMQYLNERVYIVTTDGSLACIDAGAKAIQAAQTGVIPQSKSVKAPKPIAVSQSNELETTSDPSEGVIVKCVRVKGKLRIRVISDVVKCVQENGQLKLVVSEAYHHDWNVQFPRNLREEDALFVVDEIREASSGGFYRVYGNIRRFVP
ncbi:MAG: molybdenum metabolism regulator [Candidatus Parabeggiatoa sp. nov. 2]|nr:MAG: molybdenum metabolism regulator [Gammaproteobacteria bacterium]